MSRTVTITAVQLPNAATGKSNAEIREQNFSAAEHWLNRAGEQQADIACLGETFNTLGLNLTRENIPVEIENAIATTCERLGPIAQKHEMYIIAPIAGLVKNIPQNIALVFDRSGKQIGQYSKVHCIENEKALGIVPGDDWPVFTLDFGKVGIQICHDNSFPESARCLTLNGAEIIFWPHVMGGWGGEFMDVLSKAPAIHNGIYHVPVCFGCEYGHAWRPGMLIGRSSIIAPDGIILTDAGRYVGLATTTVDLNQPRIAADFTRSGDHPWRPDMLADRRPDMYTPILKSNKIMMWLKFLKEL
ncbi:carbon-nitrogen hydrolase family protein [bacterium]|nr:carbon-nitrogen hydrolase family protein [bacterium]